MPILEVELVTAEPLPEGLARIVADAAGRALEAGAGRTWVRLRALHPQHYAESDGGAPEGTRPVFVHVLKREGAPRQGAAEEVARLTAAVAEACARQPSEVHVLYEPAASGRLAFGGTLVR